MSILRHGSGVWVLLPGGDMKHYTLFAVPILFTWTIFCHADIRFTNSTYIAQVSAAGYINRINYPLGSPDHIAGIDSVLYHSGGSTWLSMFSVLADVGLVGNVATSCRQW